MENFLIDIRGTPLDVNQCLDFVSDPACGGIGIFVGTVRNHSAGKKVTHLVFECYQPMAIREMEKLAAEATKKWACKKIAILHRNGQVDIGEIPVIIAASCTHRKEAFEACHWLIDNLKKTVPIWKKEYFEDGEVWVNAHP